MLKRDKNGKGWRISPKAKDKYILTKILNSPSC